MFGFRFGNGNLSVRIKFSIDKLIRTLRLPLISCEGLILCILAKKERGLSGRTLLPHMIPYVSKMRRVTGCFSTTSLTVLSCLILSIDEIPSVFDNILEAFYKIT